MSTNSQQFIYRLLNNKWIDIQRSTILAQFDDIHHEEIQVERLNQRDKQIESNSRELNEAQSRIFQVRIDRFLSMFNQINDDEHRRYQSRLILLQEEFEKEKQVLKDRFAHEELDQQIRVLDAVEQEDIVEQTSAFQRRWNEIWLQEKIFEQVTLVTRPAISFVCHRLLHKTRLSDERIQQEIRSVSLIQQHIRHTRQQIDRIDSERKNLNEKVQRLKLCSNAPIRSRPTLAFHAQQICRRKLVKAERILRLADRCRRMDLPECVTLSNKKEVEEDDQLALLWTHLARVQLDVNRLLRERERHRRELTRLITEERRWSGLEKITNVLDQTGIARTESIGERF